MKRFYCFRGDKEDLKDILTDVNIKKYIETKISWLHYMIIGFSHKFRSEDASYLMIKYGEFMVEEASVFTDRSPVMYKEYLPKNLQNPELLKRHK